MTTKHTVLERALSEWLFNFGSLVQIEQDPERAMVSYRYYTDTLSEEEEIRLWLVSRR